MNIAPEAEDDFNQWYDEEHIPALAAVEGTLYARRYVATQSLLKYVDLYHLTSPEVVASDAWKEAVMTPWTARIRPHMRDRLRLVCQTYQRGITNALFEPRAGLDQLVVSVGGPQDVRRVKSLVQDSGWSRMRFARQCIDRASSQPI